MERDEQLVTAVLRGETHAFHTIVTRYKGAVYSLALSYVKDFDAAYDLSQEVFLRAFLNLDRLHDPRKLSSWLRALTVNACKMALRQKRETVPIEDLDTTNMTLANGAQPETPDETWEREERKRVVLRALSTLSEESRQTLTLYYLDGRPMAEIASFLGISQAAVRQRLHRARAHLKTEVMHMIEDILQHATPGDQFQEELERLLDQAKTFSTDQHPDRPCRSWNEPLIWLRTTLRWPYSWQTPTPGERA